MLSELIKYYDTIKHLKLIQIYGQLTFRFTKPKPNLAPTPNRRKTNLHWIDPIQKFFSIKDENTLIFLNQEKDISSKTVWFDLTIDKLWRYNLHYFDVINTQFTASLSNWHRNFIERWIKENRPGVGCGWEPYPISLRTVNWIKWILAGNKTSDAMLHSLAVQIRYLNKRIEIHLQGNHLLANAKALLFAGLFFEGREAERWLKKGLHLYKKELAKQILADGGHFELSPMYHSIILEDLLDVINLFKCYDKSIPNAWLEICRKMFIWLNHMCHPDQDISFFNDSTLGVAATLNQLNEYRERLKINFEQIKIESFHYLFESGYCRIQKDKLALLVDVAKIGASYQPGHGHADALSFELSVGTQRLIINSGTSCYAEEAERFRQRSTHAHNTLVVDEKNSSTIWKSFRVGHRAKVKVLNIGEANNQIYLKACQDGYFRANKILHTRTWNLNSHELCIEDTVSGTGAHKIELYFHVHPDINSRQINENSVAFYDRFDKAIGILKVNASLNLLESTYHPGFNLAIPNKKIVVTIKQNLPINLITSIQFNLEGQP